MDHIGIDVHKRESQIYILAEEGEVVEQRIRTESERFAAVPGTRPRARILIEASTDSDDGEIQGVVAEILAAHQRLVDERRNRSKGDPFVVALATRKGFAVVTGEKASGNLQKPKIPDVCGALNSKCIGLLDLFREQGWQI